MQAGPWAIDWDHSAIKQLYAVRVTEMDSSTQQKRFQALRLQRFYLAQTNYAISYVLIVLAWLAGLYAGNLTMMLSHFALGGLTQGVFFLLFKTGLNLRFKDPSLTSAQMIVATLLITWLLVFLVDIRGIALLLYPLGIIFGVFQLSKQEYIAQAVFAVGCYTALLVGEYFVQVSQRSLSIQLVEWFVLACFLGWLSLFGNYVRAMRESLQRRHSTLKLHQETLKGMMGQLRHLAETDSLTALPNRRHFLQEAQRRIDLLEPGKTLGLALIDLDHFKNINDQYGHATGDAVLQGFAQLATQSLRTGDVVGRFGGEEFILLLEDGDLPTLRQCLDRLRQGFSQLAFDGLPEGERFTFSAGISLIHAEDSLETRIGEADKALYQAKDAGRNRCETYRAAHA